MRGIIQELPNYFEKQKKLDGVIIKQQDLSRNLMSEKLLALHVELGEMLNDWGQFKFWKVSPDIKASMLEEYIDTFHFLLSIGNEIEFDNIYFIQLPDYHISIIDQALNLFESFTTFRYVMRQNKHHCPELQYANMMSLFLRLGELVGFTADDVMTAYEQKNKVNYKRQASGY